MIAYRSEALFPDDMLKGGTSRDEFDRQCAFIPDLKCISLTARAGYRDNRSTRCRGADRIKRCHCGAGLPCRVDGRLKQQVFTLGLRVCCFQANERKKRDHRGVSHGVILLVAMRRDYCTACNVVAPRKGVRRMTPAPLQSASLILLAAERLFWLVRWIVAIPERSSRSRILFSDSFPCAHPATRGRCAHGNKVSHHNQGVWGHHQTGDRKCLPADPSASPPVVSTANRSKPGGSALPRSRRRGLTKDRLGMTLQRLGQLQTLRRSQQGRQGVRFRAAHDGGPLFLAAHGLEVSNV